MNPETKGITVVTVGFLLFVLFMGHSYYEFWKITQKDQPSEELEKFATFLREKKNAKEKNLRDETFKKGIRPSQWN